MAPYRPGVLPDDLPQRLHVGIVVFSADGALAFANPAALALIEAAGQPGVTCEQVIAKLGPGGAGLAKLASGQRVVVVAGGHLLEVESQGAPDGGVLWLIEEKSEELRLRSQLAEEATLLAHGSEAFLVVDPHGIIRYANPVCENDMGCEPGTLVGACLFDLQRLSTEDFGADTGIDSDEALDGDDDHRARLREIAKGGAPHRYNAWQRRSDASEYPVEVSIRPYRMGNEMVLLTTLRNEQRRLQHIQDLMAARAAAEAANRAKSAFMAITSHELRTPLTSIIGFCGLLQLDYSDQGGNLSRFLKLIAESSQSLLNIINDVLDLAKIEAKTLEIKVEPVDADRLVDLIADLWQTRTASKHIALVRMPSVGRPGVFYSDPLRLRQILDNLLSNALKFTPKGSIELHLNHREHDIEVAVADTGIGIPPNAQSNLFQPFWQNADATTRTTGGTGLGLFICRQIAQLLGGTVWLERSGPTGTAFRVRLPRNVEGQTGLHRTINIPTGPPPNQRPQTQAYTRKRTS